ncbi:MAG: hypothetical protein WCE82_11075 [Halobacteriota archaeon]
MGNPASFDKLFDRYFKNNKYDGGIYVVGWFKSNEWDKSDSKFKHCPKRINKQEFQTELDGQPTAVTRTGPLLKAFAIDAARD